MDNLINICHQIEIGGYKVNYVKVGHGPIAIFCFPGLLASPRFTCKDLIGRFEADGDKYTFYAWDTPGYFLSRLPIRKESDISFDADVELCAEFLKTLGHSECVIIGWSAGGQTGIQFAIKYPQVVQKLIVWGTWDLFESDHLTFHHDHRDLKNLKEEYLEERLMAHGLTFEELEYHWHAWFDMIEREHFNQDVNIWNKKFKKIQCPTLIIAGDDDPFGPIAQSQHLHRQIENSKLEIITGAPHWMQITHLDEVYNHMIDFLK